MQNDNNLNNQVDPSVNTTPVDNNASIYDGITQQPVSEATPVVNEVPNVDMTAPINIPVADTPAPQPSVEVPLENVSIEANTLNQPTPGLEEIANSEPAPVVEPVVQPIVEPTPVAEPAPVVEPVPVVEQPPVAEPAIETQPAVEVTPQVDSTPQIEVQPAVTSEPSVESQVIIPTTPTTESTVGAIVDDAPSGEAKKKLPVAYIIIGVVAIAAIAAAVYFLIFKKANNATTNPVQKNMNVFSNRLTAFDKELDASKLVSAVAKNDIDSDSINDIFGGNAKITLDISSNIPQLKDYSNYQYVLNLLTKDDSKFNFKLIDTKKKKNIIDLDAFISNDSYLYYRFNDLDENIYKDKIDLDDFKITQNEIISDGLELNSTKIINSFVNSFNKNTANIKTEDTDTNITVKGKSYDVVESKLVIPAATANKIIKDFASEVGADDVTDEDIDFNTDVVLYFYTTKNGNQPVEIKWKDDDGNSLEIVLVENDTVEFIFFGAEDDTTLDIAFKSTTNSIEISADISTEGITISSSILVASTNDMLEMTIKGSVTFEGQNLNATAVLKCDFANVDEIKNMDTSKAIDGMYFNSSKINNALIGTPFYTSPSYSYPSTTYPSTSYNGTSTDSYNYNSTYSWDY